jgi:hypothetical protein
LKGILPHFKPGIKGYAATGWVELVVSRVTQDGDFSGVHLSFGRISAKDTPSGISQIQVHS